MKIIAIVGMAGSGKSLLSEYLKAKAIPVIRFGEIIVGEVQRRGLALTPLNERLVREDIRKEHGMDACAKLALPVIKAKLLESSLVVIDGLYSFSEYKTLLSEFNGKLIVIAVAAPRKLRYERLAQRPERPLTNAEAEERDFMEIERIEKGGPIAIADYTLINDGSSEQLLAQAEALLSTML
jgi:dephospho-CoA kinase